jgi:hypothetical protein
MASNNYIYKMSNAGGMSTITRYVDMLAGNTTWNPWEPAGAYDALATVTVPSGGAASVTFAGIPTGYKHLQLRTVVQQASTGGSVEMILSNATFVRRHYLYGSGSGSALAGADTSNAPGIFSSAFSSGNSVFAGTVFDILDYNSTQNKTTRSLGGVDNNGSGSIFLMSSLYTSSSAITSITLNATSQNFTQFSQFALYGVK